MRCSERKRPVTVQLAMVSLGLMLFAGAACGGGDESSSSGSDNVATTDDAGTDADVSATEQAGSDSDEGSNDSAPGDTAADSDASDSGDDEPASEGDGEPESIEDFFDTGIAGLFAGGGGGGGFNQESVATEQREIEQRVQECMVLQGWEYNQQSAQGAGFDTFFSAIAETEDLSPEDYAAQEGFGISTSYDAITAGVTSAIEAAGDDGDPNQEMLDEMSEAERNAWYTALEGQPLETDEQGRRIDPETGEVLEGLQEFAATGGCRFEAQGLVRDNFAAIQELSDEFEELDNRIEADARISEIRRDWSDCMGGGGFFYTDEDDAQSQIQQQFVPFALGALGGAARGVIPELSDERAAALEELQNLERDIAVASLDCVGDTGEEIEEIRQRYETEFIDANRAALEAIRGG